MAWKQKPLPGFNNIKKSKPAPSTSEEVQAPKSKRPKLSKLRAELKAGNRPFFMTPKEIAANVNLGDAGTAWETPLKRNKSIEQKDKESKLLNKKLRQAKENPSFNSHYKHRWNTGPTLYDSLKQKGFEGSFEINDAKDEFSGEHTLFINDQHHRLAAMRNINPNQFINVNFEEL